MPPYWDISDQFVNSVPLSGLTAFLVPSAPSRRGDLQILGFCLLHWLCGTLPWDNVLKDPIQVQKAKER